MPVKTNHTGYYMPVTTQSQIQTVSHWVLDVTHKPITNEEGVTMGTKCHSQTTHTGYYMPVTKPLTNSDGVTLGAKCLSKTVTNE